MAWKDWHGQHMAAPIRPTDDDARALAHELLERASHAALGVIDPENGAPFVSRVAISADGPDVLLLISTLSQHTTALDHDPRASLLIGEPGAKGDPLTHPRLTLQGQVVAVDKEDQRPLWLVRHPKSALYFDFADFRMMQLRADRMFLNGGFGKAFVLTRDDLIR